MVKLNRGGDYPFRIVEFKEICLKQKSVSFRYKNVINSNISYELST